MHETWQQQKYKKPQQIFSLETCRVGLRFAYFAKTKFFFAKSTVNKGKSVLK